MRARGRDAKDDKDLSSSGLGGDSEDDFYYSNDGKDGDNSADVDNDDEDEDEETPAPRNAICVGHSAKPCDSRVFPEN
jgi:hypothetical protein